MENLIFNNYQALYSNPDILIDEEKELCEVVGDSVVENLERYYNPFINWFKDYLLRKNKLTLNFKLTYFNTISSKRIFDLLLLAKDYISKGKEINVNWYIVDNDVDIELEVTDFIILTGIEIKLIHISSNEL